MPSIVIPVRTGTKLPYTEKKESALALYSFETVGLYELLCRY